MGEFSIDGRRIGPDHPAYVIAELSANHHQRLDRARALVRAAAAAGADAIKLQTYTADTITLDCDAPPFQVNSGSIWDGRTLHSLYREAFTPWEWHQELMELAASLGLHCFSSPFDPTAVEFLSGLGVPAWKIASFELVDLPLLRRVAATGKPVICSTGMAELCEIDEAVATLRGSGDPPLALLRTNSGYPASPDEIDLLGMTALAERFGVVVGLSDHTHGIAVPVAAVALGACIVEKHLILDRAQGGPDASFSLEPDEFAAMVAAVRTARAARGSVRFGPTERERSSRHFRRSLFVCADVAAGELLTEANVRSVRPANGLHTRYLEEVLGRRVARDIPLGTPMAWDLLLPDEGEPTVTLRVAGASDEERLFDWTNDPVARAMSTSSAVVPWEDHRRWFASVTRDPLRLLWIGERSGEPVAMVRLDLGEGGEAMISVSVAPEARGRGLGKAAIRAALRHASTDPRIRVVLAQIRPQNAASLRAFEAAGFGSRSPVPGAHVALVQLRADPRAP